jgi:hypothetical protein
MTSQCGVHKRGKAVALKDGAADHEAQDSPQQHAEGSRHPDEQASRSEEPRHPSRRVPHDAKAKQVRSGQEQVENEVPFVGRPSSPRLAMDFLALLTRQRKVPIHI